MKNRLTYLALIAAFLSIVAVFAVNMRKNGHGLTDASKVAQSIADTQCCMSARYAYLMLQMIDLQQSDCFVCSASGIPPQNNMLDGKVSSFSNFEMTAYIISGSPIKGDTVSLCITTHDCEHSEEISVEAKILPIAENFYSAEFLLPRDKLPTGLPVLIDIKCGTGETYRYSVFVDSESINPHIFMNDSSIYMHSRRTQNETSASS